MMSSIQVSSYASCAFQCAVAETQGKRESYEDAHAVQFISEATDMWLLDGHHGDAAARFGAPALAKELGAAIQNNKLPSRERICQSFSTVDNQLRKALKENPDDDAKAGSTVVGILATRQSDGNYSAKLVNCGDSRGVIIKSPMEETSSKHKPHARKRLPVIVESIDHKPNHPKEKARIEAAGGRVFSKGSDRHTARIDGNLAVSRGLGDFRFKSDRKLSASAQKVVCSPDVYEVSDLLPGTLVVLACDGLWDVMTTKEVVSLVSARTQAECCPDLESIAHDLVSASVKKKSCDNVTVLLAQFVSPSLDKDSTDSTESTNSTASADFSADFTDFTDLADFADFTDTTESLASPSSLGVCSDV